MTTIYSETITPETRTQVDRIVQDFIAATETLPGPADEIDLKPVLIALAEITGGTLLAFEAGGFGPVVDWYKAFMQMVTAFILQNGPIVDVPL
jgi:hypothetical protein